MDKKLCKTFVFIFHHSIQHDEASGYTMKLIAQINIFKYVRQKHGQSAFKIVTTLEQVKRRYAKVNEDINFIKICKKDDLLPKFAKIRLAIRSGSMKLKRKIARFIMEAELQSKHLERWKLKREMIKICHQMKEDVGLILFNTVNYYLSDC